MLIIPTERFHLIAFCGLRAGKPAACPRAKPISPTITNTAHITQIGRAVEFCEPHIRRLRARGVPGQRHHRCTTRPSRTTEHGPPRKAWVERGLMSTNTDGSPLHAATISTQFRELITDAGLPPIRLHDLRHGAAHTPRRRRRPQGRPRPTLSLLHHYHPLSPPTPTCTPCLNSPGKPPKQPPTSSPAHGA
jgi:hypothetical protein